MTIRVEPDISAALNIIVNKLKVARPGKRVTQSDAIWALIEKADAETAEDIRRARANRTDEAEDGDSEK